MLVLLVTNAEASETPVILQQTILLFGLQIVGYKNIFQGCEMPTALFYAR